MLTYVFTIETGEGRATIHTDEIEQFIESFDVELIDRQPCQLHISNTDLVAPYLKGYVGPFIKGKSVSGDVIVGYSERPLKDIQPAYAGHGLGK